MTTCLLHKGRHYGLILLSSVSLLALSACDSDKPVSGNGKNEDRGFFGSLVVGGTPGRTMLSLDNSTVRGLLSVNIGNQLDSRWGGAFHHTSLNAITADALGNPMAITSATVNGVALSQQGTMSNIFVEDGSHENIGGGQDAQWSVTLADGTTFNDNITVPIIPQITNLVDYQSYDKNAGLTISWNAGGDPNAEAVITVAVDPTLTKEEGGDATQLDRALSPTLIYAESTNDNGTFTIPASDLSAFPPNVFVNISVSTYNYQTKARSDGELYGLAARATYVVPVKLTNTAN